MKLPESIFLQVVKATPLIAIDLIVRNASGQVLLGLRNNRPAQGYWFVPGGRIVKDERFADAFARLTLEEIGRTLSLADAKFIGPYEHHYADNFSAESFSTHYVVLAYQLELDIDLQRLQQVQPDSQSARQYETKSLLLPQLLLPKLQHADYRWFTVAELLRSPQVHENTKAYFHNV